MISGNIFEDYMEAQDQTQRNFKIMAVSMPVRASKAPNQRMSVKDGVCILYWEGPRAMIKIEENIYWIYKFWCLAFLYYIS